MDPYQPQQPDEGYSEDPLSGPTSSVFSSKTTTPGNVSAMLQARYGGELPPLLAQHISALSLPARTQLTEALLEGLPTCVVAEIVQKLNPRLYIDFIRFLPAEICLKILEYLDPISLISAAKSCRTWYGLALDRKLWQQLYCMEGWKIVTAELRAAEESINRERPIPSAGGHALKKRAISASRYADNDMVDQVMSDVDRSSRAGSGELGPPSVGTPTPSSKGKERALLSPPSPLVDRMPKSTLWLWDPASARHRINWKYLYSMRHKLEANWEAGKFANFQFPHPDHLEEAHSEGVYIIQFTQEYLLSGSRDRTIRIWNMHTRRLVRKPLVGHRGSVLCLQFDADPEEDLIISGSSDSCVILWRFSTGKIIQRLIDAHREPVLNVKFDKRILVTCSKDRTIKIFNRFELRPGDMGYPEGMVNPVPTRLKDYNSSLDHVHVIPPYSLIGSLEGHSAAVNAVQIHDREVVSASGDRNVKVWDWPNQTCIRTFLGHSKGIACVQYDGRRIISGSSDNVIKVFDRQSGVEVASLRSHSHLVRTVQAGFGDLPDSAIEDEKEAALVDQQYMQAMHDGKLPTTNFRRRRHEELVNNGSRRPEDIMFTGAKLPPGGGGGKYGRIVSGSYDTTVIIWRRDKEGVWKAQHHLKQEDAATAAAAAAAAARQERPVVTTTLAPPPTPVQSQPQSPETRPVAAGSAGASSAAAGVAGSHAAAPTTQSLPPAPSPEVIDNLIAQGANALQHALLADLSLLNYHSHLNAAIDRQPSPFVRSQLRQAVSTAIVRAQYAQQSRAARRSAGGASAAIAGPSSASASASAGPPFAPGVPSDVASLASAVGAPGLPAIFDAATVGPAAASSAQEATANHGLPSVAPETPQPATAAATAVPAVSAAPAVPAVPATPAAAAAAAAARPHHPHILPPADQPGANQPRVYKLQFDARRIICCSQSPVIVGWDFCNGDPELEEVVRFFATVD